MKKIILSIFFCMALVFVLLPQENVFAQQAGIRSQVIGQYCSEANDCWSGYCYDPPFFGSNSCQNCTSDSQCQDDQPCSGGVCMGQAGDVCFNGTQCESGECSGGECLGEIGDYCSSDNDCASDYCQQEGMRRVCRENPCDSCNENFRCEGDDGISFTGCRSIGGGPLQCTYSRCAGGFESCDGDTRVLHTCNLTDLCNATQVLETCDGECRGNEWYEGLCSDDGDTTSCTYGSGQPDARCGACTRDSDCSFRNYCGSGSNEGYYYTFGCSNGDCEQSSRVRDTDRCPLGDPCAGVVCPSNYCDSGNWNEYSCVDGDCEITSSRPDPGRCSPDDPCAGVDCGENSCDSRGRLTTRWCENGSCYSRREYHTSCQANDYEDCSRDSACRSGHCVEGECRTPTPGRCGGCDDYCSADGRYEYESEGCYNRECIYDRDRCDDANCSGPPYTCRCAGLTYRSDRECTNDSCTYQTQEPNSDNCRIPEGSDSRCSGDDYCLGGLDCVDGVCGGGRADGEACETDLQCANSGICANGVCGLQPDGVQCTRNEECSAGVCLDGTCGLRQDGQTCSNGGQCAAGVCINFTCGYGIAGESCNVGGDCSSGECEDGQCVGSGTSILRSESYSTEDYEDPSQGGDDGGGESDVPEIFEPNPIDPSIGGVQGVIGLALRTVLGVSGALAIGVFVYGGASFMTAGGNAARSKKSLQLLFWSALGAIVMLSSYAIVDFIFEAFR